MQQRRQDETSSSSLKKIEHRPYRLSPIEQYHICMSRGAGCCLMTFASSSIAGEVP